MLVTKTMSTGYKEQEFFNKVRGLFIRATKLVGGRAKYWYCTRCMRRWPKGAGVIRKK